MQIMSDIVFAICRLFEITSNKASAISGENALIFDKTNHHSHCRYIHSAREYHRVATDFILYLCVLIPLQILKQ